MPIEISLDHENKIIIIQVEGRITIEEYYYACNKAFELCKTNTINKLLVNLSRVNSSVFNTSDSFKFGKFGANSTINPFVVKPNSINFIYWDCQPMLLYFIKIEIEAAGQNYAQYGFTILRLNIFY